MLTLTQIEDAHLKVKSGADFPQYVRDLFSLGVLQYSIYVYDGHAEYAEKGGSVLHSEAKYPVLDIANEIDSERFALHLKSHQQGKTNYLTFCQNSAEAGVNKWTVDIVARTCTYYDKSGGFVLREEIPSPL